MVKVLIVDDSKFIRRALVSLIQSDQEIEIVGQAADGVEALQLLNSLDPDILTLDVEMPRMDGLSTLQKIMDTKPTPVIMISSLTQAGAETTLKAMELGALDFFAKPSAGSLPELQGLQTELCAKIKYLAKRKSVMRLMHKYKKPETATKPAVQVQPSQAKTVPPPRTVTRSPKRHQCNFLCIGVSTGGPPAVQKVLSALPKTFPAPIFIAQHMPAAFTGPFAARLNTQCAIEVIEAQGKFQPKNGTAYIAPGGKHLRLEMQNGVLTGQVSETPKDLLYKPSVNELMASAAKATGRLTLGVILTGMGNDGLEGIRALKEKGGLALAQSEASCVVYGMPKAIVDFNLADAVVDIDEMAAAIMESFSR